VAIGYIKATEALGKKPHITLKKPQFIKNIFKKPCNPWKSLRKSSKIIEICIKSPHSKQKTPFLLWKCLQKA
jgi:hypothetical protein